MSKALSFAHLMTTQWRSLVIEVGTFTSSVSNLWPRRHVRIPPRPIPRFTPPPHVGQTRSTFACLSVSWRIESAASTGIVSSPLRAISRRHSDATRWKICPRPWYDVFQPRR
jgi:hypothetical protein